MPSKKKKYNARFPPARIKKIMQTDDDVGKVAAAVPVIISRSLELFIESLILKTSETTKAKNAKTLSSAHIKQTIQSERRFDFLKDLVANVPDVQPENEESEPRMPAEPTAPRPRGRPRKKKEETTTPKKRGRKKKTEQIPVVSEEDDDSSATEDATSDIDGLTADECEEEDTESSRVPFSAYPPNPQLFSGTGPPHHADGMGIIPPAALGASAYVPPYTAGSAHPSHGHPGHFYPPGSQHTGPNPHFFPPGVTVDSQPGHPGHYLPPSSTAGSLPNTGQSGYFPECNTTHSQVGQSSPYFPESSATHTHHSVSQPGESASYFPPSTAAIPQPTASQRSKYFSESFATHSKPQPGLNSHFYPQSHSQPNMGLSSQLYPGPCMMSPTTGSEYYPPGNMITSRPGMISPGSAHAHSSPDQHNIQHMPLNLSSKGTMPESELQKHAERESFDKFNISGESSPKAEMPESGTVPGKLSSEQAENSFMPGFYQPKLKPPTSDSASHNCIPASFQDGAFSKDQMSVVGERSLLTAEGAAEESNTDDDYDS